MLKRRTIIIALLILLAAFGVVVFVTLIANEPKNEFDGILVREFNIGGENI